MAWWLQTRQGCWREIVAGRGQAAAGQGEAEGVGVGEIGAESGACVACAAAGIVVVAAEMGSLGRVGRARWIWSAATTPGVGRGNPVRCLAAEAFAA